tara:strand:- start:381 stop:611 length:231 start_codon:yes stop_codon:yes gene_type:complete
MILPLIQRHALSLFGRVKRLNLKIGYNFVLMARQLLCGSGVQGMLVVLPFGVSVLESVARTALRRAALSKKQEASQ